MPTSPSRGTVKGRGDQPKSDEEPGLIGRDTLSQGPDTCVTAGVRRPLRDAVTDPDEAV
jgi:hypothetical protein